jgi:hypothetical protein
VVDDARGALGPRRLAVHPGPGGADWAATVRLGSGSASRGKEGVRPSGSDTVTQRLELWCQTRRV